LRFADLLAMAFSNLWRRKLRTSLTILAVVIGATLVTLVISLSNGLERFIVDQFGLFVSQETVTVSTVEVSFSGGGPPREISVTEVEIAVPFSSQDIEKIKALSGVTCSLNISCSTSIAVSIAISLTTYHAIAGSFPFLPIPARSTRFA